jgi:hypothetical protein
MGKENFSRYNQQVECFFCNTLLSIYDANILVNSKLSAIYTVFFDEKEIV